jgi:1-hydroxycarotenoid 3,4-desaturase
MSLRPDVVIIGAGIGGLSASILLGAAGLRVLVLERANAIGGKAGTVMIDGVEVDTGPSVLTLPHVFDEIFLAAGMRREEQVELTQPEPAFRYIYRDGTELDVFHEFERTLDSVTNTLGKRAGLEFESYLASARTIWEAAAPHFVYNQAPDLKTLLFGGPSRWGAMTKIDPFRSMKAAIFAQVASPHLRMLLSRYATYNGSDVRTAPATLGCISHVELALGGYGVAGGMIELVRALSRAATQVGVEFRLGAEVDRVLNRAGTISGVRLTGGEVIAAQTVLANTDAAHLFSDLLGAPNAITHGPPSMSAHTGIIRAVRPHFSSNRAAHTVLFPADYGQEFHDIFDAHRVPTDPTVYLCSQEACHRRTGWRDHEPLFCMINAPALESLANNDELSEEIQTRMLARLTASQVISSDDRVVWWRTPADLAARFPGSFGSLYGAASNTMMSAFQRPGNKVKRFQGLYVASGSAHPGGGVPMVALSGKQAARLILKDRRIAA